MIGRLQLWMDDDERDGPSNMAVDEWLLGQARLPVMRVYHWEAGWGSYGYFVKDTDAAAGLAGLKRVRRWTGGGIVDHRTDWTYTLVVPRGCVLAEVRGGDSYRWIHQALAEALPGGVARLAPAAAPARGGFCFARAVEHDLVDGGGGKLAGAGQRRTRLGLLHQGSLAVGADAGLAARLAAGLADEVSEVRLAPAPEVVARIREARYAAFAWRDLR